MSSLLAESSIQTTFPARVTSIVLGPASCAGIMLLAAAISAGASIPATATAFTTVLILPYLTGWALKEHRLTDAWTQRTRSALRHGSAAAVGAIGVVLAAAAGAPASVMQVAITLIAGSLLLGLGRAWSNASAHVGMVTLLAMWLISGPAPVSAFALLLVPVMAWSRIQLGEHTGRQATAGIGIGIAMFILYLSLQPA